MTRFRDAALSEGLRTVPGKLAGPGIMCRVHEGAFLRIAERPARTGRDLLIRRPARAAREPELVQLAHVIGVEGEAQFFAHLLQKGIGPCSEVLILDEEGTGPIAEEFAELGIAATEFADVRIDGIPRI